MKKLLSFEKKVLAGLNLCGVSDSLVSHENPLGLAVSGGADSVSLLISLCSIFGSERLRAITVDHGIRSEEESGGDALFVADLCGRLGVFCHIEKIPCGKIDKIAGGSGRSVEDVARAARYEAFDSFIEEENLAFLCLAHNQNDNLETILMRFLQGSGTEGMGGIKCRRRKFIRPLLDISRAEIESYLIGKNQDWRTDATNFDTKYLRNKVRNRLVPVLNENFPGWQGAVLSGAKKSSDDEEFLHGAAESQIRHEFDALRAKQIQADDKKKICFARESFFSLEPAIQRRVFFSALNEIGFGLRFPFSLFEEVSSWKNQKSEEISFENVTVSIGSEWLEIIVCEKGLSVSKNMIDRGFSFLFKKSGERVEIGNLIVCTEDSYKSGVVRLVFEGKNPNENSSANGKISFLLRPPFLVRSAVTGDLVKTVDGKYKNLSDVFNNWKIPSVKRSEVLVVEEFGGGKSAVRAVIASFIGAKNWIVEEAKL